jgi:small neutral amino acid transporter SnatA (MarC family)
MLKIFYTNIYSKKIDKLLTLQERPQAEDEIAISPLSWPIIKGTSGIRKARTRRGTKGKSGGIRIIITFWYKIILYICYRLMVRVSKKTLAPFIKRF